MVNVRSALWVALVCACLTALVNANRRRGRGRGRGGRGGRNRAQSLEGENVSWTRQLVGQDTTVNESAFMPAAHNVVIITSTDNSTSSLGDTYQPSTTYYGFAGSQPIMVIATDGNRNGKPCFLAGLDKTYDQVVADVRARNGSLVTTVDIEQMSGLVTMMPRADAQALVRENPMLRRVCRRIRFYDTRSPPTTTEPAVVPRTIRTLTFYSVAEITFREPVSGGRRGGRGQGRRNRNRQGGGARQGGARRAGRRRNGGGRRAGGRRGRNGRARRGEAQA